MQEFRPSSSIKRLPMVGLLLLVYLCGLQASSEPTSSGYRHHHHLVDPPHVHLHPPVMALAPVPSVRRLPSAGVAPLVRTGTVFPVGPHVAPHEHMHVHSHTHTHAHPNPHVHLHSHSHLHRNNQPHLHTLVNHRAPGLSYTNALPATNASARSGPAQPVVANRTQNLSELCSSFIPLETERQLLAYVSNFETVAVIIHDLDEAVQQLRPMRACDPAPAPVVRNGNLAPPSASSSAPTTTTSTPAVAAATATAGLSLSMGWESPVGESTAHANGGEAPPGFAPPISEELATSSNESPRFGSSSETNPQPAVTTESFLDPPVSSTTTVATPSQPRASNASPSSSGTTSGRRAKRESPNESAAAANVATSPQPLSSPALFGQPSNFSDSPDELTKTSNELKALRKELSSTAEMLRTTNHTIHSALLRALATYVSSIERRIESHHSMTLAHARMHSLKEKVALVQSKMTALLEKLRQLISHKPNNGNPAAPFTYANVSANGPFANPAAPTPNREFGAVNPTTSVLPNRPAPSGLVRVPSGPIPSEPLPPVPVPITPRS